MESGVWSGRENGLCSPTDWLPSAIHLVRSADTPRPARPSLIPHSTPSADRFPAQGQVLQPVLPTQPH